MQNNENSNESDSTVPFVSDENSTLGDIHIKNSVVANIVRISTQGVPGVHEVGGARFEGISEMFTKKEAERGIRVRSDEAGNYEIEIHVILDFGVELAKTGGQIQQTVREEVSKMTNNGVARVDVLIDGVHVPDGKPENGNQWDS